MQVCVHYMQFVEEEMGTVFDSETEAYMVQAAIIACIDQIGIEWLTGEEYYAC